jgi:predicted ATP-grasp superfamily ATP-dependent carboligase
MLAEPLPNPGLDAAVPGVVILGGAHGTLALARSLAAMGVPVTLVSNDTPLPGWSRHVSRKFSWPGPDAPDATSRLLDLAAKHGLAGALLIAGGDAEVQMVSRSLDALSAVYRVSLPAWEQLQWVCEKPLLYRRAAELGLAVPLTYAFASVEEAERAEMHFPVVLKPNMGGGDSALARAKVVRADDKAAFLAAFEVAACEIGAENVVVQQLIPGGGKAQFSYAGLWSHGEPVAEFTARRLRQYPVEFGYTSTFVEVVEQPEAIAVSRRLLSSVSHHGLVEIEFKHDARNGGLKLLDVNPRPWSWFGLAGAAGLDLGAMLWATATGVDVGMGTAQVGTAWMYLARDMVAAAQLMARGELSLRDYLGSFRAVKTWAAFAPNDPVPGVLDLPLTAWRVLTRRVLKERTGA